MNKNKKVIKTMSSVLCASMLMGSVTPVFAATTDTQTTSKETDSKSVEVTYDKSASYFVTIPKTIVLDSNKESTYSVKVEGDIPSNKNVYVAPVDAISQTNEIDFYMKDQSTKNIKADVVATVTHNKDTWDFEDASSGYEETNNSISALGLSSGNWKGTFNFNINLRDVANSGDDKKDDVNYGEDVTLTSDNLATYGIANTGDVVIPSEVVDGEGVKHKVICLGTNAFSNCTELTSITIPNSVTSIVDNTFYGCRGLTSIVIPDSVTTIGNDAFAGCTRVTSITIPESVTSIGNSAFVGCSGLSSITIPESVTSIGNGAFSNCLNLVNITLPSRMDSFGSAMFSDCYKLNNVTIPEGITNIEHSTFMNCNELKKVTLPSTLETIGASAFNGCQKLSTINIPNSVTSIGNSAFSSCWVLTSITLPDNIMNIGDSVFKYSNKLSSVTYKGTTYTNKTQLTSALTSNGVSVGNDVFNTTKLQ